MVDPWLTGNPAVPESMGDPESIDIMLLSHGHIDHIGDAVRLAEARQPKAVIAIVELAGYLEGKGVQNTVGFNKGGSTEAEGIRFTMTDAAHSSSITDDDGNIIYLGDPAGYVITLEDGYKIYFSGDTSVFGGMGLIGELYAPDLAMLCIGDFYTMGPYEAAKAVELLGVKRVLGMHYGTFPGLPGTPGALRDELATRGVEGVEVEELAPGDTLS